MKTIKEEITAIATIMNMNLTTTILQLHDLGYNFTKSINEQTTEIDKKLSQMLLESVATTQEEPEQEIVEEQAQEDEKYEKYKIYFDDEIQNG